MPLPQMPVRDVPNVTRTKGPTPCVSTLLGISIGESADTVSGYGKRTGLTYTLGLDESTAIAAQYRIVGIPTHFFVDPEGVLRDWRIGSMSQDMMKTKLDKIMAASTGGPGL